MAEPYHGREARMALSTALGVLLGSVLASGPAAAPADPDRHFPAGALVGWSLVDAAKDSLLDGRFADRNFTPGSIQKLFTTWIALDLLGGDKTYATGLFHTGTIADGALKGDLVIRGGGDPAFGGAQFGAAHGPAAIFSAWAGALQKLGVRRVEGCVIGDGSYLDEEGPHPAVLWEDAGNYYAGTASGLSYHDNLYAATFSGAAAVGKTVALLGTAPRHTGIAGFDNRLLTGPPGGRDSAYIMGGYPSPTRVLNGTFPAGRMPFSIKGSLPNPAWTCAREFRDFLSGKGIAFSRPDDAGCGDSLTLPNHIPVAVAKAVPGATHISPPLRELARIVNQKSDNNYAAQMLALLGKGTGRAANWRGGLEAMGDYLGSRGFDRERVHFKDGNGVSRYNWVAPSQTTKLLVHAFKHRKFPEFRATLLGAPGSVARLVRYGNGWEGRLWVKTGTLEGVSSLAGYIQARSGKWLAFAICANNFDNRDGDPQRHFVPLLRAWAAGH